MPDKKILIIDDERDALEALTLLFEFHDFHVLSAHDGQTAWEIVEREKPDLILADYLLPRLNGLALYHRVKLNAETRNIPFMLMSGAPPHFKLAEAYAILLKPIDPIALVDQVRRAVEQPLTHHRSSSSA